MKKILYILLILISALALMATISCGNDKDNQDSDDDTEEVQDAENLEDSPAGAASSRDSINEEADDQEEGSEEADESDIDIDEEENSSLSGDISHTGDMAIIDFLPEWAEVVISVDGDELFNNELVNSNLTIAEINISDITDIQSWSNFGPDMAEAAQTMVTLGIDPTEDIDTVILGVGGLSRALQTEDPTNIKLVVYALLDFNELTINAMLTDLLGESEIIHGFTIYQFEDDGMDFAVLVDEAQGIISLAMNCMDDMIEIVSGELDDTIAENAEFSEYILEYSAQFSTANCMVDLVSLNIAELADDEEFINALESDPDLSMLSSLFTDETLLALIEESTYLGVGIALDSAVAIEVSMIVEDTQIASGTSAMIDSQIQTVLSMIDLSQMGGVLTPEAIAAFENIMDGIYSEADGKELALAGVDFDASDIVDFIDGGGVEALSAIAMAIMFSGQM